MTDTRRQVPRTDVLLADPRLEVASARLGRARVKSAVAQAQDEVRRGTLDPDSVVTRALAALPASATEMRPVLNATGVIVHTNLGRAVLSDAAVEALTVAAGATDVELDLATGRRGRRGRSVLEALADAVPSAEAVHVVNNGAAALVLAATALATEREIVVSRGELVEIGDGFRLPDLLESTGARLREVGTTNRTTVDDYADAVGPQTAFVLKVHPSNFLVTGFTATPQAADLAALPVPLVVDIGSGLLAPDPLLPDEPDAESMLRAGAALVTASGDKLLGGPQAGLLLGRAELVDKLRRHPLARALRVDKLRLAALEATVRGPATPTHTALHADLDHLWARCTAVGEAVRAAMPARSDGSTPQVDVVESAAIVGGGGAPGVALRSHAIALDERLAGPLRTGNPPLVGRVERGRLLLDLRCVPADRDHEVVQAVLRAVSA